MSDQSNFKFWFTRILVMLAVIAAAIAFLIFNPEPGSAPAAATKPKPSAQNKMAENVSRFYAEFRQSSRDPIKEQYGDYVIPLEQDDMPLEVVVNGTTAMVYNDAGDWLGALKQRAFSQGSTLMKEADRHVTREGMSLVWHLNQDFVVKHRFVSENTLAGMLKEIATAVDANFITQVRVYYCPQKRTMVITDTEDPFLVENCKYYEG